MQHRIDALAGRVVDDAMPRAVGAPPSAERSGMADDSSVDPDTSP